jgi:hypothetical protein
MGVTASRAVAGHHSRKTSAAVIFVMRDARAYKIKGRGAG